METTNSPGESAGLSPPRQRRSAASLERLLDATEAALQDRDFEEITVAEIVRRARLSIGAFYGRFRGKDDLLLALNDRFSDEAMALADELLDPARWEGARVADILQASIPFVVEVFRKRRRAIRAFAQRIDFTPTGMQRPIAVQERIAERLERVILPRKAEVQHPDPALAIRMGLQMVLNALERRTLSDGGHWTGLSLDDDRLSEELTRMVLRYAGLESPAPAAEATAGKTRNAGSRRRGRGG